MTATLLALLRFSKQAGDAPVTWRAVAAALAPIYNYDLTLYDVLRVLVGAYEEVVLEARFDVAQERSVVVDLLLAPVKGYHSLEFGGPPLVTSRYTVEQFYEPMVRRIVGQLAVARVDWCPEFTSLQTLTSTARPSALPAPPSAGAPA